MIVPNRRKREKFLRRFSQTLSRVKPPAGYHQVMSGEHFQLEINKEIQRSNRRTKDPEFAIVSLDFCDHEVNDTQLSSLISECMDRLRVSDSIGWHSLKLAFLLPETGIDGAKLVCNSLLEIAKSHNIEVDPSISIYPWDDLLRGPHNRSDFKQSADKGSDGSESNWTQRSVGVEPPSATQGYRGEESTGGVATLSAPSEIANLKTTRSVGTGSVLAFRGTEKTPFWKRAIDVTGAGVGLMLLSPVFLAAAVAIKVSSKGPVFFRQEREGKDGEVFSILKFRTMCDGADAQKDELRKLSEQDGPAFKLENDPRITGIGRYLRKSCIDELPQLFNVITGDMSIVGPRPLPVNESEQCLPWQRRRLSVLPGLTCTWQAHGGRDVKFSEWMRMDLEYIQQRSLWSDLKLIGETAMVVVLHKGSV